MREIRMILGDLDLQVLSMKEAGIDIDIVEDGTTFEENALIKARAVAACAGRDDIVLADDSGLEIDYLNGEPGIYSARYMGEDTSYRIKNANLIGRLEGVPKEKKDGPVRMRHCGRTAGGGRGNRSKRSDRRIYRLGRERHQWFWL